MKYCFLCLFLDNLKSVYEIFHRRAILQPLCFDQLYVSCGNPQISQKNNEIFESINIVCLSEFRLCRVGHCTLWREIHPQERVDLKSTGNPDHSDRGDFVQTTEK